LWRVDILIFFPDILCQPILPQLRKSNDASNYDSRDMPLFIGQITEKKFFKELAISFTIP